MKQIKTIITLLAFALTNTFSSNANATEQADGTATKEATMAAISEIHIIGGYDAQLIPGDKFSYKATCNADYADYLVINVEGNSLKASIKPFKKSAIINPVLIITYPSDYAFNDLDIRISAGTKLDIKDIKASDIDIDVIAGAALFANKIDTYNADINLNAGSTIKINSITSSNIEVDYTSGSGIDIRGIDTKSLEIDGNSGADGVIEGKAIGVDIDLSSAASIKATKFNAEVGTLEVSSGASINIGTIEKEVDLKATTGGYINYSGKPSIKNIKRNSGGSIDNN